MTKSGPATTKLGRLSKRRHSPSQQGQAIFELRTYHLRVGAAQEYVRQFELKGLPVISQYCTLVGYWIAETGLLNKVVHLWRYESFEQRQMLRHNLANDPAWRDGYIPSAAPLIVSQENTIMMAPPFSPLR